jgi:SpoVK/Ycf46/Vps4 family AAA+-type ATPase
VKAFQDLGLICAAGTAIAAALFGLGTLVFPTKADLKADLKELATKAEIKELRGEVKELRGEFKTDLSELRGKIDKLFDYLVVGAGRKR